MLREKKGFINQIALEKEGNEANVPNSVVLFGAIGTGKTTFARAVADETGCNVIEIAENSKDFTEDVSIALNKSKQNYIDNKQRTIIIVNEADLHLSEDRENKKNISTMKGVLDVCAQLPNDKSDNASAATFFFTTNHPLDITDEIIFRKEKIGQLIMLEPAEGKNIEDVIKFYKQKCDPDKKAMDWENYDFSEIVDKLNPNMKEGAFGNDSLKAMVQNAYEEYREDNNQDFEEHLFNQIDRTPRNIRPKRLEEFNRDIKELGFMDLLPSIEVSSSVEDGLEYVLKNGQQNIDYIKQNIDYMMQNGFPDDDVRAELTNLEKENSDAINFLSDADLADIEASIQNIKVNDIPLADFWLDKQYGDKAKQYTPRLKTWGLKNILADQNETDKLTEITLGKLKRTNSLIKTAKECYVDILQNETELTDEQKDILLQQQENELFFKVVTNNFEQDGELNIWLNTISTLKELNSENETVRKNVYDNIFSRVENPQVLLSNDPDDKENVGFVFGLLAQKIKSFPCTKQGLDQFNEFWGMIGQFMDASIEGDENTFNECWNNILNEAKDYFDTQKLKEITDKNVELLNSIQQNSSKEDDPVIKSVLNNPNLTIEQKEFVIRYKDDKNLKLMLKNPNVDKESVIPNLLYLEFFNKELMQDDKETDGLLREFMSKKFLEANQEYDINAQGRVISKKLDSIDHSIKNENAVISSFADSFMQYADKSLSVQLTQFEALEQINNTLNSINQNTIEIKSYTKAVTRAKLLELEKDKYYKEVVPDIANLLPEDEQVDIQDFLTKVDNLAKKEKNAQRRNKLIKAALIVAGVAAASAAVYYAGPAVVEHLASGLSTNSMGQAMAGAAASTGLAVKSGSSAAAQDMSFGRSVKDMSRDYNKAQHEAEYYKKQVEKYPGDKRKAEKLEKLTGKQEYLAREIEKKLK